MNLLSSIRKFLCFRPTPSATPVPDTEGLQPQEPLPDIRYNFDVDDKHAWRFWEKVALRQGQSYYLFCAGDLAGPGHLLIDVLFGQYQYLFKGNCKICQYRWVLAYYLALQNNLDVTAHNISTILKKKNITCDGKNCYIGRDVVDGAV